MHGKDFSSSPSCNLTRAKRQVCPEATLVVVVVIVVIVVFFFFLI
jgi:hypothetical protein